MGMHAAVASCVGMRTVTGSPPEVSKVRSEATWSASSSFTAGHHCVSNSCPAALHRLPQGESYALGVRLEKTVFTRLFFFCGILLEIFVLTCKVTHPLLRVEPEDKLHRLKKAFPVRLQTERLTGPEWLIGRVDFHGCHFAVYSSCCL